MKKIILALLVACTVLSACASNDAAAPKKTRSNAAETLPCEDK